MTPRSVAAGEATAIRYVRRRFEQQATFPLTAPLRRSRRRNHSVDMRTETIVAFVRSRCPHTDIIEQSEEDHRGRMLELSQAQGQGTHLSNQQTSIRHRGVANADRVEQCTGERPACSFCANRGAECSYEYEEGLTRLGSLRQSLEKVTARADNLEFLFGQLQSRSDNDAACLLAVIRMGADLDMICEKLRSEPDFLAQPDLSQLMWK